MTSRSYSAVVLAGARSERLGGTDKASVLLGERPLLDHVLVGLPDPAQIIVVGPERSTARPVVWCPDLAPPQGPLAACAQGLAQVESAEVVVVLGCDLPFVGGAVSSLVNAVSARQPVAVLVDVDDRLNYLACAWDRSTLTQRLADLGALDGVAMRRLFDGLEVVRVTDRDGWGTDCDTWEDLHHLNAELSDRTGS